MDRNIKLSDTILLFDNYSLDSQSLHESFKLAGCEYPAVVIDEDGFLPEDVLSVYGSFLGDYRAERGSDAKPKFFNEISVPDYWEISGNNNDGRIMDLYRERGRIFYAEPKHKRYVKVVDWYDERGIVRFSDHYNRYGAIYARTIFNAKGQRVNKSYFSATGQEIIVENFVTGDIILNEENGVKFFRTKTDLVLYFLKKRELDQNRIFYNSLSIPSFVSNRLIDQEKRDILFWQESLKEEIPGNMQIILNGNASRTAKIVVQKKQVYYKLLALGVKEHLLHRLGYIYPFIRDNQYRQEALICTNSDNIEQCHKIIEALPQMHFHIAALTEMSSKLMSVEEYENVSLYPNVKLKILDELFEICDFYFDINYASEIVSAVRRAFLNNQLIFSFQETIHNRDYVADDHIYLSSETDKMIADVKNIMEDSDLMDRHLAKQHEAAMTEDEVAYAEL